MAHILRLMLLAFSLFSAPSFAEILPVETYCRDGVEGYMCGDKASRQSAYKAWIDTAGVRGVCGPGTSYAGSPPPATVYVALDNSSVYALNFWTTDCWGGGQFYNEGGGLKGNFYLMGSACPANSTSNGSGGCSCTSGYYEVDGKCESSTTDKAICDTWSALNNTLGGIFTQEAQRYTGDIADGAVFCSPVDGLSSPDKGCKMQFDRTASYGYGDGVTITEGSFTSVANTATVDSSCTPGTSNSPPTLPPTQEPCKDGFTGQVNGVDVCVSVRPDSGVGSTTTTTSTNNGTETQAVTTQNQTQCANGVCTTTTTTTTTTTNNSTGATTTGTTTGSTSQSQEGFCLANEDSKLCSDGTEDGSSFTGSCTTEFVCEGDAIQCAIAREQHKRACKMFDDESPESKLYEDNKGKEGNQTGDLPGNETISLTGRINSSDALGAGSAGVSDLQVTVWGQSISLPFSQINPYLAHLGNVLLAVSFLIAVRIVARG